MVGVAFICCTFVAKIKYQSTCRYWKTLVRSRVLQLLDQAWSDGLDGNPFRNTVSG